MARRPAITTQAEMTMPERQTDRAVVQIVPAAMNKKSAASYLGVNLSTFDELMRKGEIVGRRVGPRTTVFLTEELRRLRVNGAGREKVYFIVCGKFVKIGVSKNTKMRLSSLKIGNPMPLKLAATIVGDYETERNLHEKFASHKHTGEWFHLRGNLARYIAKIGNESLNSEERK